jgi:ABC-2 type transport system ATP-binding protein
MSANRGGMSASRGGMSASRSATADDEAVSGVDGGAQRGTRDRAEPGVDNGAEPGVAVQVTDLRKAYGSREILAGVSFAVQRGELFSLLGPNGAGKTTTVEIVEGYRRPDGGSVRVLGLDPGHDGTRLRPRIGLMLQEGGIDNRTTPREVLRLFARFYRDPEDPDRMLQTVDLERAAGTRYRRLSGGERQRLSLALALLGRPELLVLDEPTAGMDPAAKQATRERIAALRAAGTTILLTTHELGDVERLADHVAVLDRGRLVAYGTPAELTGSGAPRIRFRLSRVLEEDDATALGAVAARLAGGAPRVVPAGAGAAYEIADLGRAPDPALVAGLATWCAERGLLLTELRLGAASLEERYLELVGSDVAAEAEGAA